MTVERVPSGIYGLDELIQGGFPRRRTILVSGATGTGKSVLSMQFIYRGAAEYNEPGVFVTFDEMPDKLRQDMLQFGWNLQPYEDRNLIALLDGSSARAGAASEEQHALLPGQMDFDKMLIDILAVARKIGAKRLVIDSIPAMAFQIENEGGIRRSLLKLAYVIGRAGLTTIITTEVPEQALGGGSGMQFSKYGIEEYISDGVILLNFLGVGSQATRTLYVRKMRSTAHSMEIHPLEINERGITVKKIEDTFK
jgi:KaiC/GvpD/RAD55 family RecA-like ATPase